MLDKDKLQQSNAYNKELYYRFIGKDFNDSFSEAIYYPYNKLFLIVDTEKAKRIMFLRNIKKNKDGECFFEEEQVEQLMKDLGYSLETPKPFLRPDFFINLKRNNYIH